MNESADAAVIDLHGHTLHLQTGKDSISRHLKRHRVWEPFETRVIKSQIKEGDVVLDLGANIGYYTLLLAKLVGKGGHVFAFEPNPHNCALLRQNVQANGYRNVTVVQKAVSNDTRVGDLYLAEDDPGDHRIYASAESRERITIDYLRLDDYFRGGAERVDFVKMDVQGAEASAIEGMRSLLEHNETLSLLFEFWPAGLSECGCPPEKCLNLLTKHQFVFYDIGKARVERTDIPTLLEQYSIGTRQFTNVFCARHAWQWGDSYIASMNRTWWKPLAEAAGELTSVIPPGRAVILVDDNQWIPDEILRDRRVIPFLERDGQYWGPPQDDETAIRELDRLRREGVEFAVFGWPAFWWLDEYSKLHEYLRSEFRCVLKNPRVVVFDLRHDGRNKVM